MENKKSNNMAVCIICGVLTAFGIVASIISLIKASRSDLIVVNMINLMISGLIGYYAVLGYRKLHGNLLKFVILLDIVIQLGTIYLAAKAKDAWPAAFSAIIAGTLGYISGRLHRVKQNIILMIAVTILLAIVVVNGFVKVHYTTGIFTPLIIWIDICAAYILRYKEHKDAGLIDTPKN